MGNHCYSFNGTNKLQLEGRPVGLNSQLSGALVEKCMLSWSRQFLTNITTSLATITCFQLYILRFYGDDTNMVVEELESRYREGRVVVVD